MCMRGNHTSKDVLQKRERIAALERLVDVVCDMSVPKCLLVFEYQLFFFRSL